MRERHELEKGVVCEKCKAVATKKFYKRIMVQMPIADDTTGRTKLIQRINLCNNCYEKYEKLMADFIEE